MSKQAENMYPGITKISGYGYSFLNDEVPEITYLVQWSPDGEPDRETAKLVIEPDIGEPVTINEEMNPSGYYLICKVNGDAVGRLYVLFDEETYLKTGERVTCDFCGEDPMRCICPD